MGFFSGGPAIWELADPRSTLRQVGGTVEILVRTATLATFRDDGFTAFAIAFAWSAVRPKLPRPQFLGVSVGSEVILFLEA